MAKDDKFVDDSKDTKEKVTESKNKRRRSRNNNAKSRHDRNYVGKKPNDISWHAKSQQLLKDAASIPWSYSTGREVIRQHLSSDPSLGKGTMNVPGIFAIKTVLTPGVSTSKSDAINIASQALYTDIRSQLKSANAYDASDVMIYMCEMAEIKAIIAFIRRILGTPLNYSFMNSYLPDNLIKAQGIDPASLHNDYAKYRSKANQCIAKASQIWWPKGFDYVTRAEWEYGNYYTEGESIKDQIYMFTPGLFRKFTYDEDRDYAGKLEPCIKFDFNALHSIDEVIDALSDMIDSVVGDSDFQNIAGDLFNRYGASGVETFTLIPDSYIINPSLSYEVLEQIQNARCLRFIYDAFNSLTIGSPNIPVFDISQDEANNMLYIQNVWSWNVSNASDIINYKLDMYDPVLTVDKDPSPDKTMLITRCTNILTDASITAGDSSTQFDLTYDVAMEFVVAFEVYYNSNNTNFQRIMFASSINNINTISYRVVSPFHYHPILTHGSEAFGVTTPHFLLYGALDTYAVISPEQVKDMNRVDLMSLFAVPDVGSVNK